jgi:hypothetical protein
MFPSRAGRKDGNPGIDKHRFRQREYPYLVDKQAFLRSVQRNTGGLIVSLHLVLSRVLPLPACTELKKFGTDTFSDWTYPLPSFHNFFRRVSPTQSFEGGDDHQSLPEFFKDVVKVFLVDTIISLILKKAFLYESLSFKRY